MVRRAVLIATLAACARPSATVAPAGHVAARGTLGYAAAFGAGVLATIELDERFALYVRDPDSGAVRARYDLGPPERDLPALAIDDDGVAWVGGTDRVVRGVDLATGAVRATWPIGAPVTALCALPGGWLAVGDAAGALCLRRRADGALVQCVVVGSAPVVDLTRTGITLAATSGDTTAGFAVPSLAAAPVVPVTGPVVDGHDVIAGGRTVVHFAGPARAVARGPRGQLVAVGWIRGLDDPSVVVIPADRLPSLR